MKMTEMSTAQLEAELQKADDQILQLKRRKANEEGPLLSALRMRRSHLLAELANRLPALAAA